MSVCGYIRIYLAVYDNGGFGLKRKPFGRTNYGGLRNVRLPIIDPPHCVRVKLVCTYTIISKTFIKNKKRKKFREEQELKTVYPCCKFEKKAELQAFWRRDYTAVFLCYLQFRSTRNMLSRQTKKGKLVFKYSPRRVGKRKKKSNSWKCMHNISQIINYQKHSA